MSELKIMNSSFEDLKNEHGVSTRSQTSSSRMQSIEALEKAHGFKLQDAELLSQCISKSAICSSCRNPKSELQLFQENSNRDGLAESLYLKCSTCDSFTPLQTSKRLGGKGGGAHEVNRRSVLSSHQWGRAGLEKFCAGMELPPPVTKKAYNQHMKKIKGRKSGPSENQRLTSCLIKLGHLAQAQNQRQMEKGKEKGRTGNPGKRQTVALPAEPDTSEIEIMFVAPELEFVAAPQKNIRSA